MAAKLKNNVSTGVNKVFFHITRKFNLKRFLKKAKKYDQFEQNAFEEVVRHYESSAPKVEQRKLGLTLVVISDTHGDLAFGDRFEEFISKVPKFDLMIILGDMYTYELDIITKLVPPEKIIGVRGNHDSFRLYADYGIFELDGKGYIYKGVKFAGIEGSFKYKVQKFPSYTHYESLLLASEMPQEADVLITHDAMFTESKYDVAHSGLIGITYYAYKNAVKWHIHGHTHKSYDNVYSNGTYEKCVYGCEVIEI